MTASAPTPKETWRAAHPCRVWFMQGWVCFSLASSFQFDSAATLNPRSAQRPPLLGCGVVVVTDDARDFPCAVFVLPQMNELPFTNGFCVLMSRVVKTMNSNFDRAIALHVIHL